MFAYIFERKERKITGKPMKSAYLSGDHGMALGLRWETSLNVVF